MVFVAGWAALHAQYCAFPAFLEALAEGPRQSVGVNHPNSTGRTKVWVSITPTRGATAKHGSPSPQRLKAGDKIRSGPQVGLLATPTLPSGRSPTLQSGGQKQRWPTSGLGAYITLDVYGIPNALERRTKTQVAHKWAWWLHHPFRLRGPQRFNAGVKIESGPQMGLVPTSPLPSGGSPTLGWGTKSEVAQKCA